MKSKKPQLSDIPIEHLVRGKYQPRRDMDEDALQELAQSIRSNGLIQPIIVRPIADNQYEIVAGERRWRAALIAGQDVVRCLINHYSDEQAAEAATVENIQRKDLNPIEVANAYQRLINDFNYAHEEVAAAVGKSRTKVTNTLRLLKLAPEVKAFIIAGKLRDGHGKILAGLPTTLQLQLAEQCVARGWSVRKIEQEAKKRQDDATTQHKNSDPNLKRLANVLSEHIGSDVKIDFKDTRGNIQIDFTNLDILEGIFEKIGFNYEDA